MIHTSQIEEERVLRALRESARLKYVMYARWTQTGDSSSMVAMRLGQAEVAARTELFHAIHEPPVRIGKEIREKSLDI